MSEKTISAREKVGKYVYGQIAMLTENMKYSGGKAMLANLRRGAGKTPGELPELWGIFLNGIPDEMLSRNGEPTKEEWAIYISLTLYALHQQGNSESIHKDGVGFGKAAAMLMNEQTDKERERVLRRFGPAVTANDMYELSHHMRCLIELMRNKGIKLDYAMLAKDIYDFQFSEGKKKVQLRWGQDFYYIEKGE